MLCLSRSPRSVVLVFDPTLFRKFPDIRDWYAYQRKLIENNYDNIQVVTGREGTWKSLWMRKRAPKLDPLFSLADIHFGVEDFHARIDELKDANGRMATRGRAQVLDEFKGHRRGAMTKERTDFLDFVKECRGMLLHLFIGYPRITRFERDLVNDRISYWVHMRKRGLAEVRQPITDLAFDTDGQPVEPTRYPIAGKYTFTGKNDPLRFPYEGKKEARMQDRAAGFLNTAERETSQVPFGFNEAAFREAVIRSQKPQVNPSMLSEVQRELKR